MPNVNRIISPYLGSTGNPDTAIELIATAPGSYSPYAAGDIGNTYDNNDKCWQKVALDSGATSATPTGVVAANQLAFWKDRANYIVTNDSRMACFGVPGAQVANSYRNNVAGVFRSSVPAGATCWILQRGRNVLVKEAGSATAGMVLTANTGSTAADALGVALGTAPGTEPFGVVTTATAGGNCTAALDMPNIP